MPGGPRKRNMPTGPLSGLGIAAAEQRHRLGMTQRDLAELAGVGLSSVHALETGSDRLTMAVVQQILDVLGLTLAAGTTRAITETPGMTAVGGSGERR